MVGKIEVASASTVKDDTCPQSTRRSDLRHCAITASCGHSCWRCSHRIGRSRAGPVLATERRKALLELHGWWVEWATVARKHIKRRDVLINIGLGVRKKRKGPPEE